MPVRIEIGPRDVEKNQVVLVRRDTGEKAFTARAALKAAVVAALDAVQKGLYDRALKFREEHTTDAGDYETMKVTLDGPGGFLRASWCGDAACEERIKSETKATIRAIPFDQPASFGACVACGKPGKAQALFARAY